MVGGLSFAQSDIERIAAEILPALDSRISLPRLSERYRGFGTEAAYRVTAVLRRLRRDRGETPVGRKIGFTNRTIWAEYGVFEPIWGDMFDSTVRPFADGGPISLAALTEPRIEPEIAFKIAAPPTPGMTERDLLGAIEWVAHGFEIVQSVFPGWRFNAAEAVAAGGLHGRLALGPPAPVGGRDPAELAAELAGFRVTLSRDDTVVDQGAAANVLDGPLHALAHLVKVLARDPVNPPLAPGEIVTTGTLTRAFPVAPGERWSTSFSGIGLDGLSVTFE